MKSVQLLTLLCLTLAVSLRGTAATDAEQEVHATLPWKQCPTGLQLTKNECVLVERLPVQYMCPESAIQSGRLCIEAKEITPAEPACADGFVLNVAGTICRRQVSLPPVVQKAVCTCPEGFDLSSDEVCVKTKNRKPRRGCPKGTTRTDEGCSHIVTTRAQRRCRKGFGYDAESNKCHRSIAFHGERVCDKGVLVGETCVVKETAAPLMKCQNFVFSLNQGVESRELAMCQKGFVYKAASGLCERKGATYPSRTVCPDGYNLQQATGVCTLFETSKRRYRCEEGETRVNIPGKKTPRCEREEIVDFQMRCPKGFSFDGTTCTRRSVKQAKCAKDTVFTCERGIHDEKSNACIADEIREPEYVQCQAGFVLTSDGTLCTRGKTVDPISLCPAKYKPEDGFCVREHRAPVTFVCPAGYSLDAADNVCTKRVEERSMGDCITFASIEFCDCGNEHVQQGEEDSQCNAASAECEDVVDCYQCDCEQQEETCN